MTPSEMNVAIAEACGWTAIASYGEIMKGFPTGFPTPYNAHRSLIPDYLSDLNAMHEAENIIPLEQRLKYSENLRELMNNNIAKAWIDPVLVYSATAHQRAEAFLKTLNKWKD